MVSLNGRAILMRKFTANQFSARSNISPLIRSADLNRAIMLFIKGVIIIGLQKRIREFCIGNPLITIL